MDETRKIIHIDMDAFYASVEQRDHPELRGKPVAVGGKRARGVVAAASYEARKYGVRSAMPSVTAQRKCPDLIFVQPRFEVYKKVSGQIHEIFHRYTDNIEPLSLDEAYLDVTTNKIGLPSATLIARAIKRNIREELNLVASAGVSVNKFLAKVASDEDKPDGLFVILPSEVESFISRLPVERFFGVGKVTAEKMKGLGIHNGGDLAKIDRHQLIQWFGKSGGFFYDISRGIDHRPVNPHRIRKSVGVERTFNTDREDPDELEEIILSLAEETWKRTLRSKKSGRTVTIKIKYNDFEQITRSKSTDHFLRHLEELKSISLELLRNEPIKKPIRLMGVTLSNFREEQEPYQLTFKF